MKNNIFIKYSLLLILAVSVASCMEEDEKYATLGEAPGSILVSIPVNALPAAPAGQPQIAQPDINVVSGRFATTDDLTMTITLPEGLTNLTISTVVTGTGIREQKASFTGVNGSVDWVYPVNTLNVNNAAPAAGSSVVLQLTASNDDGSEVTSKMFSVSVLDPFALATTNLATAYADSTITLGYTVPASTTLANVTKVELLAKRGVKGVESLLKTNTHTDVRTVTDKFTYTMPSENPSGALDTIFYRIRATYATGRTVTKSATVRFINVPLSVTTTGVAIYNSGVTGANAAKAGYDFGKLTSVAASGSEVAKDIKLQVTGLEIGVIAGTGNATTFLKVEPADYTAPTFQSLRKLFTAPTAVPLTVVPNVFVGDVYAVEIDGGTKGAKYGIFRVTAVTLTPGTDNADFITIDVKTK
jgi:hypothetical protein